MPPEFCPFTPGLLRELVWLDESDGAAPWQVVDMAIPGSWVIGAASRNELGDHGAVSHHVDFLEHPEVYRFDPGIDPICDL